MLHISRLVTKSRGNGVKWAINEHIRLLTVLYITLSHHSLGGSTMKQKNPQAKKLSLNLNLVGAESGSMDGEEAR